MSGNWKSWEEGEKITCRNHYALLKWTVNYKQESWKNHLKTKNLRNFFYTTEIV